jgi:hypothetical protein
MIINYEITDAGVCGTPCPHGRKSDVDWRKIIKVGSHACHMCRYCEKFNGEAVTCSCGVEAGEK